MALYRIMFDEQINYVEADNLSDGIDVWRRFIEAENADEEAHDWDEEYPESIELMNDAGPVWRGAMSMGVLQALANGTTSGTELCTMYKGGFTGPGSGVELEAFRKGMRTACDVQADRAKLVINELVVGRG